MFWKNEEQYPDYTAAQAMLRMAARSPEEPDTLDDEGCRLLIIAIIRQALHDHDLALQRLPSPEAVVLLRETEDFFRSDYFRQLSHLSGEDILALGRKEALKNDDRA